MVAIDIAVELRARVGTIGRSCCEIATLPRNFKPAACNRRQPRCKLFADRLRLLLDRLRLQQREICMKKFLLATAVTFAMPAAANAQSDWFSSTNPTYQGFYIGAQGGLNWLL